jgi:hypothetical protein
MDRINHSSAEADKFGAGKDGFTDGDPSDPSSGTIVNEDFLDGVQEELIGLIEQAGETPTNADYTQLADVLLARVAAGGYQAQEGIEWSGLTDAMPRLYDHDSPTAERYIVARFGPSTARTVIYFNGSGIEFAHNCFWSTGTGWVSTGTQETLITLSGLDASGGPAIIFAKTLVSNAFTEATFYMGDPGEVSSTVPNVVYPIAIPKIVGHIHSPGGSVTTPVLSTKAVGFDTPQAGDVTSSYILVRCANPFADTSWRESVVATSDSQVAHGLRISSSQMQVSFRSLSAGTTINPLTTYCSCMVQGWGDQ